MSENQAKKISTKDKLWIALAVALFILAFVAVVVLGIF